MSSEVINNEEVAAVHSRIVEQQTLLRVSQYVTSPGANMSAAHSCSVVCYMVWSASRPLSGALTDSTEIVGTVATCISSAQTYRMSAADVKSPAVKRMGQYLSSFVATANTDGSGQSPHGKRVSNYKEHLVLPIPFRERG